VNAVNAIDEYLSTRKRPILHYIINNNDLYEESTLQIMQSQTPRPSRREKKPTRDKKERPKKEKKK